MTSHELASKLLSGDDMPVLIVEAITPWGSADLRDPDAYIVSLPEGSRVNSNPPEYKDGEILEGEVLVLLAKDGTAQANINLFDDE